MEDNNKKNFEIEVLTRLAVIESKLDGYAETKTKADEAFTKANDHEKRLTKIEDNYKWLWRTVVGTIIASVVGVIFAFLQAGIK